jgi:mono/diheme cytochrome c family protein
MKWLLAVALIVPAPVAMTWPGGPGKEIVATKCGICHGPELIASQRLTPAQWTKEVDKMVGWGAPLDPAEKAVLAAYLARHFGPDRPIAPPKRVRFTEN